METQEQAPISEPKKQTWSRWKKSLVVLLIVLVLFVGLRFYRDKPTKLVQAADSEQNADQSADEVVDYRSIFESAQDAAFAPPEENGWRLILQALGPCVVVSPFTEKDVPWETLPTDRRTKKWFADEWTSFCEKFKLDPLEKPTMYDRMSLYDYVGKYGLTGNEPEPDYERIFDDDDESFEEIPAKVNLVQADLALRRGPWTAADYPFAARWIEENADLFDVLARAARSPRLGVWRIVPENGFADMFDSASLSTQNLVRLIEIRACYRIGSGDLSGAIDDAETMALFGRSYLESEVGPLIDRLAGTAVMGMALGVPLFENPDVEPTAEELERVLKLWSSFYGVEQRARYIERMRKGEKIFSCGSYAELLAAGRQGEPIWKIFLPGGDLWWDDPDSEPLWSKALGKLFDEASSFDDAKSLRYFEEIYDSAAFKNDSKIAKKLKKQTSGAYYLKNPPERTLALAYASNLIPATYAGRESVLRIDCVAKEAAIATALLSYRAEHGTFPPAFTVDASGRPLQSWRVLILPYLGDDAKALYDKIRLDEPWDSEYNAAFHAQEPDVFRCPSVSNMKEGETIYSVLLGDEGFFDESGVGKDPKKAISDPDRDVWSQFLVVERAEPICWMTPNKELKIADFLADGEVDAKKFFENHRHNEGLNFATLSGACGIIADFPSFKPALEARLRGTPIPEVKEEKWFSFELDDDEEEDFEDEESAPEGTSEDP